MALQLVRGSVLYEVLEKLGQRRSSMRIGVRSRSTTAQQKPTARVSGSLMRAWGAASQVYRAHVKLNGTERKDGKVSANKDVEAFPKLSKAAGSAVTAGRRRSCPQPFPLANRGELPKNRARTTALSALSKREGPSGTENGRYANRNTVLMFPYRPKSGREGLSL